VFDQIAVVLSGIVDAFNNNAGAAVLGATLGAALSGLVIYLAERRKEKIATALRLIEEYTSPSFLDIRADAGIALRAAMKPGPKSWDDLYHSLDKVEWSKISKMDHFYQKLDLVVSVREAHNPYIKRYFGREFPHWYVQYFEPIIRESEKQTDAVYFFPNLLRLMGSEIAAYREKLSKYDPTRRTGTQTQDPPAA